MKKKIWMMAALVAPALVWLAVRWGNSLATPDHELGLTQGRLAPCPDSPNCVATRAESDEHKIEPLQFTAVPDEAFDRLKRIVAAMSGSRIVTADDDYFHAEFRSRLLGFVDDVEFRLDDSAGVIHFRSASRVGHSDLGANRARMEEIRERFEGSSKKDR